MRYDRLILELFNTRDTNSKRVYDGTYSEEYSFVVARRKYKLIITKVYNWSVGFEDKNGSHAVTGKGDAAKVFGRVLSILIPIINQQKPKVIEFSAHTDQPSRLKLYRAMVRVLAPRVGYVGSEYIEDEVTIFKLTRIEETVPTALVSDD